MYPKQLNLEWFKLQDKSKRNVTASLAFTTNGNCERNEQPNPCSFIGNFLASFIDQIESFELIQLYKGQTIEG